MCAVAVELSFRLEIGGGYLSNSIWRVSLDFRALQYGRDVPGGKRRFGLGMCERD